MATQPAPEAFRVGGVVFGRRDPEQSHRGRAGDESSGRVSADLRLERRVVLDGPPHLEPLRPLRLGPQDAVHVLAVGVDAPQRHVRRRETLVEAGEAGRRGRHRRRAHEGAARVLCPVLLVFGGDAG